MNSATSSPANAAGRAANTTPKSGGFTGGNLSLPMAKIKTIMKSSPEVENVSQESLFLITKATGGNDAEVTYADLSGVVQKKDSMEFLHDILPNKIKFREYLAMMQEQKTEEEDVL